MSVFSIRRLCADDIQTVAAAFAELGWQKPVSQYERYLAEQENGKRVVLVAWLDDVFCGYITICWQSHYRTFREENIPEIVDFNVLPQFRQRGIGTLLMDEAEGRVAAVSGIVGIGVGMTADYGVAQCMYIRRGYIPDGRGLMYEGLPVNFGKKITIDDDLCLYFKKELSSAVDLRKIEPVNQVRPVSQDPG